MMGPHNIGLFVEDEGHRAFIGEVILRVAKEENVAVEVNLRNSTGGSAGVMNALRQYARDLHKGLDDFLDLLIVAIDGNCHGVHERRKEIEEEVGHNYPGTLICAVPDPHVERWYLLDLAALRQVVEAPVSPEIPDRKCERNLYKTLLRGAFDAADIRAPAGGIEYAHDIVWALTWENLREHRDFMMFLDELQGAIRLLRTRG